MRVKETYRGPGLPYVHTHDVVDNTPELMTLFKRDDESAKEAYQQLVETGATHFGWSYYQKI